MAGSFVHRFKETFESIGESFIALGAAEAAGFLEIGLSEAAAGAFHLNAAGGLLDFLGGAKAKQEVSQRESSGVIHLFGIIAFFAQIHFLHFI